MNGGDLKWLGMNGSGRLWCWLGISEWRATSECGALSFLLVTQSGIGFLRLTLHLQLCCKSWCALFAFLSPLRRFWWDCSGSCQCVLWNCVRRSDFTREYQTWRLQHEVADYTPDNLTLVLLGIRQCSVECTSAHHQSIGVCVSANLHNQRLHAVSIYPI